MALRMSPEEIRAKLALVEGGLPSFGRIRADAGYQRMIECRDNRLTAPFKLLFFAAAPDAWAVTVYVANSELDDICAQDKELDHLLGGYLYWGEQKLAAYLSTEWECFCTFYGTPDAPTPESATAALYLVSQTTGCQVSDIQACYAADLRANPRLAAYVRAIRTATAELLWAHHTKGDVTLSPQDSEFLRQVFAADLAPIDIPAPPAPKPTPVARQRKPKNGNP